MITDENTFVRFNLLCKSICVDGFTQRVGEDSYIHPSPLYQTLLLTESCVEELMKIDLKTELRTDRYVDKEKAKQNWDEFTKDLKPDDILYDKKNFKFYRFSYFDNSSSNIGSREVTVDDKDRITKKDALKAIENIRNEYEPEEQDDDEDNYDWFTDKNKPVSDYGKYRKDPDYYEKDYKDKGTSDYFQRRSLDESYSKFKTETKTRGKSDQFHQAVREVRKKVQEINRLFEYVSRLKSELSEGEGGLKYKMHTEKALAKIKEMVSELNQNIKKFK
jgi:hypothetical protein